MLSTEIVETERRYRAIFSLVLDVFIAKQCSIGSQKKERKRPKKKERKRIYTYTYVLSVVLSVDF